MSILSVAYEDFSSSNQGLVTSGGPWSVDSDNAQCVSDSSTGCNGYCLACQVFPPDSLPSYHPVFSANISVNLANYGGATTLDFTWSYWPLYCGSNVTAGSHIPIHSQVGDANFDDTFAAIDFFVFFQKGHQWDTASKLSHSGSTSVVRGSDLTKGYIPLSISFTMTPTNHDEYLNYYMQGIGFQITTPQQSVVIPSTSSSLSASASSSSSSFSSSGITSNSSSHTSSPPNSITQSDSHTQHASTLLPPSSSTFILGIGTSSPLSASTSLPVGIIAGIAIGAIVLLIALLIIALFLFFRRRGRVQGWKRGRKGERGLMADPDPFMEQVQCGNKEVSHEGVTLEGVPQEGDSPVPMPPSDAPWAAPYQPTLDGTGTGTVVDIGDSSDQPTASSSVIKATPSRKRSSAFQGVNSSTVFLIVGTATTTPTTAEESESRGERSLGSNGLPLSMMGTSRNFAGGDGGGEGAGRPISLHPSFISITPSDPPPTYGHQDPSQTIDQAQAQTPIYTQSHPRVQPQPHTRHTSAQHQLPSSSFSPELARFAQANRDMINENLEARLQAAGYLPTDDPSRLTPDEWKVEYGITRLELRRLVDLYTRSR